MLLGVTFAFSMTDLIALLLVGELFAFFNRNAIGVGLRYN